MKRKIKIGREVELWNHFKGKITNIDPSTCRFEINGYGRYYLMDIKFLDGISVDY